jgi:hypothetical protein
MQFLLLIHGDERAQAKMTPAQQERQFGAYMAYTQELIKAGVHRGGEPLTPSEGGAKVTVREGKARVVDGPFTESKEVLGGFYMVECASRDEAIKWAAKCPGAEDGTMEVREVMYIPKPA